MLKVGEGRAMKGVSQTVTDQTDMRSADSHTFMRENLSNNVLNLQVHHLEIEDASNLCKTKENRQCPKRVNP